MASKHMEQVKTFQDYIQEPEFDAVDKGLYQMEVAGYDIYEGDNGDQLQLNTRFVGGDQDGKMGPAIFLDPNARTFSAQGKEIEVTEADARKRFSHTVNKIHNEEPLELANPAAFDDQMLEELGGLLDGDIFIAQVKVRDNGRNSVGAVYSLANPPRKWKAPVDTEGVTV